jgi:hypothetical protein
MKLRSLALILSIAFFGVAAMAHGDFKHVIGTVEKTSAESVTVKTASGSAVEVKLVAATIFIMRSGGVDKPAKASDLAVGDRVVIHARPKGNTLEAAEVKFSAAPGASASKPKS